MRRALEFRNWTIYEPAYYTAKRPTGPCKSNAIAHSLQSQRSAAQQTVLHGLVATLGQEILGGHKWSVWSLLITFAYLIENDCVIKHYPLIISSDPDVS